MANINISVDTKTKEIAVSIDGQPVSDVSNVHIYRYADYSNPDETNIECNICTHVKGENGVRVVTDYYARGSKHLVGQSEANLDKSIAGFLGVREADVAGDIAKYLAAKSSR